MTSSLKPKRRVLVVLTGGTMCMRPNASGQLEPVPGYLQARMRAMPEIRDDNMPCYDVLEYAPLLDSADMCPSDWCAIARDIARNHDNYDGFVVLLGTDTMAYCASALSFMLENLGRPVVLTGSMVPFAEAYSDARKNLVFALIFAGGLEDMPREVCIFFHDRLLRGCRASKVNALALSAFDSPNFPPIATVGVCVNFDRVVAKPASDEKTCEAFLRMETRILVIRMVPGFDDAALLACFENNTITRAVVLELYGTGTAPSRRRTLVDALQHAKRRDVVVVATTQCRRGGIIMDAYAVGEALLDAEVVPAGDMTTEAASTKLAYLLGKYPDDNAQVRRLFAVDLRGEVSPRESYARPFFPNLAPHP